jgi:hypothetical protein
MTDTQHNFAKKLAPRGSVDVMEHAGFKARLISFVFTLFLSLSLEKY